MAWVPHAWIKVDTYTPVRLFVAFCAAAVLVAGRKLAAERWHEQSLDLRFMKLHAAVLVAMVLLVPLLTYEFVRNSAFTAQAGFPVWLVLVGLLVSSATATLFPLRILARIAGKAWPAVALAGIAAWMATDIRLQILLWNVGLTRAGDAVRGMTFQSVRFVLHLFTSHVISDPATAIIGTANFQVVVGAACSGVEGMLLMLMFTCSWLVFVRKELRLARAVLLVPCSLLVIWPLNTLRIALLIAMGASGHPSVALNGFHWHAGWIYFNAVAVCFLLAAQHVAWFRKDGINQVAGDKEVREVNQAAVYLLPFLAILATSLLTQALSGGFEWLYPLRFLVAVVVLWEFRAHYRRFDWRSSAWGPLAGMAVFAMWLGLAKFHPHPVAGFHVADPIGAGLAGLGGWQRWSWIVVRAAAAVVTVPIAEELAFRGYLARRFVAEDIGRVPLRSLTLPGIVLSSVAFGLMHGSMWLAGLLAGLAFAALAKWRGRLGESVAAHAVANLMIAVWVLARGDYSLW